MRLLDYKVMRSSTSAVVNGFIINVTSLFFTSDLQKLSVCFCDLCFDALNVCFCT